MLLAMKTIEHQLRTIELGQHKTPMILSSTGALNKKF